MMIDPDWLPSSQKELKLDKSIRQIFYLREGIYLNQYLQHMQNCGVRPIRYLPQLKMIVGEYNSDHVSSLFLDSHPYLGYTEPDLRITIKEPFMGILDQLQILSIPWGVDLLESSKVWTKTKGKGIRVAIIDTGISSNHPAIKQNYKGGFNVLSPQSTPQDFNGHGTHVAGIIAGRATSLGVIGVAPKVYLYAVKAFNRKGNANLSDLLSAINWCIENEMQVINMSFGMEKLTESLRLAVQIAHRRGIIMIAATGNKGAPEIDFPARYPETIAVTSISKNLSISPFSNSGEGVDIAAPGDRILSSWLDSSKREMSGTSMAVPHVTGVVALILYLNKNLNPEQVRFLLKKSAKIIENDHIGLVNAKKAIYYYEQYL